MEKNQSYANLSTLLGQLTGMNQVQSPDGLGLRKDRFIPADTKLNFEKRVLTPSQYPSLPQEGGGIATHKMAWSDTPDGGGVVYPTIIQQGKQLVELNPEDAYRYAMDNGEFRKFKTQAEADAYAAGGYKNQWGAGEPKTLVQQLQEIGGKLGQ